MVAPQFFDDPRVRAALADLDFGTVFTAVREHTGLSQMQLGALLDLSQSRVSAVERGERHLTHIKVVARIAQALGIPAPLLGFDTTLGGSLATEEVSWVDRRDFITLVTAATLGSNLHPELARLGHSLPGSLAPVTRRRIGMADVEAVESITDGFRRWDLAHGGGLCRTAAIAQLHQVRTLDDARCTAEVHTRLLVATAELASMAGWLAYDVEDHNAARRLWTYALDTARRGGDHPRSTDLAVSILLDLAHQSLHLKQPTEALKFVQLASSTAGNREHPVSTITEGYISAVLGWCRGSLGQADPTRRAVDLSQNHYAAADPNTTPPWAWFVTDAEIAAQHGHSLYLLSLHQPSYAPDAIERMAYAARAHATAHERSRAVLLPPLASAHFRAGDVEGGVRVGYDAITAITGLTSTRCFARLRDLDAVAAPFGHKSEVADLRADIAAALPGAA